MCVLGLGLKVGIEKVVLERLMHRKGRIEDLFESLLLVASCLLSVSGQLIAAQEKGTGSGPCHQHGHRDREPDLGARETAAGIIIPSESHDVEIDERTGERRVRAQKRILDIGMLLNAKLKR